MAPRARHVQAGLVAGLAAVYYAAAKLGLLLATYSVSSSPVWPATGIAIAALLLGGVRLWPGVFVGAFLANLTTAGTVWTSLGIGIGNTLEGVAGALLVTRFAGGTRAFERTSTVVSFAALAVLAAPVLSATIGVGSLALAGFVPLDAAATVWFTWWLGDAVGALIVTPAIVLLATRRERLARARVLEGAALAGLLAVTGAIVFGGLAPQKVEGAPLAFLFMPTLAWAALRFAEREIAATNLIIAALVIGGTVSGFEAFAPGSPNRSLLLLQAYIGVMALTGLMMASVAAQARRTEDALRESQDHLERRVEARTASILRANEELARVDAQLADAQSVAHVGSWEWDVRANRVTWSAELYRIYGLEKATFDPAYEGFLARVAPEDRARVDGVVQRAYRDHRPFQFDHRIVRPDGAVRWLHARGRVFVDATGAPERMTGTGQDVTEHRAAEDARVQAAVQEQELARLRQVNAFKTQFINNTAHELGTPLTPIRLQLHRIMHDPALSSHNRRSVEIVHRNVERLGRLVGDMLDSARLQAGRLGLRPEDTDLTTLVGDAVESFHAAAEHGGVRLEATLAPGIVRNVDPARVSQVLFNLLSNAIKFTPRGGRVEVELLRTVDGDVVRVRDTGIGIHATEIERLFQPFTQLQGPARTGPSGTGLGLYISRGLVELHGGRIWCESPGARSGATFTFVLPHDAAPVFGLPEPATRAAHAST